MITLIDANKVPHSISEYETIGDVSDGYHTFDELYNFRMLYNAAFFNELAKNKKYNVHKSKRHSNGEACFGGGWFIVMATLPTGQISNHYELKDWDLFHCEEREFADTWDMHSPNMAAKRLKAFIRNGQRPDRTQLAESSTPIKNKSLDVNGHEYVDLGLPSGTLWAKCNVGAEKETDYGGYYQWGGVEDFTNTKKNCNWKIYPYGKSYDTPTKYNTMANFGTVDNKTELELSDDVANQIMGGDWHIPSREQFCELVNNTTSKWTTVGGVNGRRFTSKFNGQSIFIPAAGYRDYRTLLHVDYYCYLWSSSLYQARPSSASSLCFNSHAYSIEDFYRYYGFSVRGVIG